MGSEIAIACPKDRVEHCFVEKTVTHPFRDDDIDLRNWEGYFLDFSA
jgi:hypothetical protein